MLALLSLLPRALGGDALSACDGLTGKEQVTCIEQSYPRISTRVEGVCASSDTPRECRKREYGAAGITFVPGSSGGGGSSATSGASASSASAAKSTSAAGSSSDGATWLTVRFVGACVGPGKTDGSDWDGPGKISPTALDAVAVFLTKGAAVAADGAVGEVASEVVALASTGPAGPDVIGYVTVVGPTSKAAAAVARTPIALGTQSRSVGDTYTPTFGYTAEYKNWPVFADTRFEVSLWDADLSNHDPIGVVQLNATHLKDALEKGTILEVPVADQSSGQLLTLKISVTRGKGASQGSELNGTTFAW